MPKQRYFKTNKFLREISERFGEAVKQAGVDSLKKGAEAIAETARKNCPVDSGRLRDSIHVDVKETKTSTKIKVIADAADDAGQHQHQKDHHQGHHYQQPDLVGSGRGHGQRDQGRRTGVGRHDQRHKEAACQLSDSDAGSNGQDRDPELLTGQHAQHFPHGHSHSPEDAELQLAGPDGQNPVDQKAGGSQDQNDYEADGQDAVGSLKNRVVLKIDDIGVGVGKGHESKVVLTGKVIDILRGRLTVFDPDLVRQGPPAAV